MAYLLRFFRRKKPEPTIRIDVDGAFRAGGDMSLKDVNFILFWTIVVSAIMTKMAGFW